VSINWPIAIVLSKNCLYL